MRNSSSSFWFSPSPGRLLPKAKGACLTRHLADRRDTICLLIVGTVSILGLLLSSQRSRSVRSRNTFPCTSSIDFAALPESSRRRFNRVSNWSFISRLFHGALFASRFYMPQWAHFGTGPKAMGSRRRQQSTTDLERKQHGTDRINGVPEFCEPPLRPQSRSSLFFIGTDRRGNWVVRDQAGLCGGLFVNRSEALRFAMLENGRRPQAVIMVPGILEFSIDGPAKAAADNNSTGVAETNGRVRPHDLVAGQRERGFMVAAHG